MFTDWTQADPKYFYMRGAICGIIWTLVTVNAVYQICKLKGK